MTQDEMRDQLERIVDQSTLAAVVRMLTSASIEKAEHIRTNWQDKVTARPWDKAAGVLDKAAGRIDV